MNDKALIEHQFGAASATYDSNAVVQADIAARLAAMLESRLARRATVLEVGCGTGLLSAALIVSRQPARYYLNDISAAMLDVAVAKCRAAGAGCDMVALKADAEHAPWPEADAVVSASAVQWFDSGRTFVSKAAGSLRRGGIMAVATFGPDNYREIRTLTGRGLHYPTPDDWRAWTDSLFDLEELDTQRVTLGFGTVRQMMRHMRATGVNALPAGPMGMAEARRFAEGCERLRRTDGTLPLTYNPLYIVARRL